MKISVIIPVWNGARHLGDAIRSVLAQTYAAHEILVVDDASTDGTPSVARSFGAVRYLRQEKAGAGPARNLGMREAAGDLLAFLDHDDLWIPEKLALQVELLARCPDIEVATGWVQNFLCPTLTPEERAQLHCPPEPIRGFSSTALVARRSAFEKAGWWPASAREGVEWFAHAREARVSMGEVPQVVAMRRLHQTNITRLTAHQNQDYTRILHGILARRRHAAGANPTTPATA